MSGAAAALETLLGGPETAWLLSRVRRRILRREEGAAGEVLTGVVRLNDPTPEQRAAAWRLVGRPRRAGDSVRVDLAVVEEILRRGPWPAGLADAVETLTGPIVDHAAERDRERAAWDAARDALWPAARRFPGLGPWWEQWCGVGGLKRAAAAEAARAPGPGGAGTVTGPAVGERLASDAAAVLDLLPAGGEPLAVLARRALGDAHGLDSARPLGRLVAGIVRAAFSPETAEDLSARDVWARAGVVLSTVASTALCLGVAGFDPADVGGAGELGGVSAVPAPRAATAAALEAMRAARMPLVLTLEQVRSGGVRPVPRAGVIHVCENPTVVEVVADRWARAPHDGPTGGVVGGAAGATAGGVASGPVLVCTSGQPSTAVVDLLAALTAEGAAVRYHGDFDWAGLRIARSLARHVPWLPWRFEAGDYRAALSGPVPSLPLTGSPAESPWDPGLARAMAELGLAVEEEAVAQELAADVLAGVLGGRPAPVSGRRASGQESGTGIEEEAEVDF
ncbi:TIGR02679 family protein [Pseudactinotalea sp. HY158]|uniref:TIGR02679 family protein n=1 Tax=Pseudactinotalea sp. HY158 TaxID=2654547 RepID=UPI00129C553A|nr:TIGR02679 family protein [Pseudactinotalea sp. HY158]QGH69761.1 TIGR02679 family protein [Pseudactinotalea sp. HY158]